MSQIENLLANIKSQSRRENARREIEALGLPSMAYGWDYHLSCIVSAIDDAFEAGAPLDVVQDEIAETIMKWRKTK